MGTSRYRDPMNPGDLGMSFTLAIDGTSPNMDPMRLESCAIYVPQVQAGEGAYLARYQRGYSVAATSRSGGVIS